jgi:fumarate reductase flavoprotein subunit
VNKDGYRYLQDYDLGKPVDVNDPEHPRKSTMELGPRDRLSQAFVKEQARGGTIPGPYGDYVHLDLRHLGAKRIGQRLPFIVDLCREYVGLDPVHDLIPVRPVVHYTMGGVHTDRTARHRCRAVCRRRVCLRVDQRGQPVRVQFAHRAAGVRGPRGPCGGSVRAAEQRWRPRPWPPRRRPSSGRSASGLRGLGFAEPIVRLREELNQALEVGAAIERDAEGCSRPVTTVAELKARLPDLRLTDHSATFNTELTAALELENMIDVAECVVHSALARTESRGAHQRRDFPKRDDQQFLKHSLAYRTDAAPRIEYRDVVITRWPPKERHYG